jgi:hypothetical protein
MAELKARGSTHLIPMLRSALLLLTATVAIAAEPLFVAVGYGGRRMTSRDGVTWENVQQWAEKGEDDGNNLMSAVFAQGKFVVTGGGGGGATGAGHILVSTDGVAWRETLKDKGRINPVAFGGGRFIVGTSSWPSGKLMWSADAETWQTGAKIQAKGLTHFRGGTYGNGVFVLVGNGQQTGEDGKPKPIHWAIATPDGERIASERTDLPGHGTIVFGAGHFLMLTSHSNADLIRSKDGAVWEPVTMPEQAKLGWLVWTGREFLAGAKGGGVLRSADGSAWEKTNFSARSNVVWSDGQRFIATGWPGKMSYSADGAKWQDAGQPQPAMGINRVVARSGE